MKQEEKSNAKAILQNVKMDASVNFMTNGDIHIYPCPWEGEKEATASGKRVRYQGGIEVDADGRTRVKRYNVGMNGPRHETLFETAHGAVKMTRPRIHPYDGHRRISEESVYVMFRFPKKYGVALIKALYKDESEAIMAYLKTRKEDAVWS